MRLFRCIEGILRQEGAEFFQQLNYLLAVFKENRDGAFSERYLFRFWDNLALSQRDRTLFERLLNLFVITRRCLSDKGKARSRFGASKPGVCNTSNVGRFPSRQTFESFALPFRLWRLHKCLV